MNPKINNIHDAEALMKIGFKRPVAKVLASLSKGNEKTSQEMEKETELRQPEVSNALKELNKRGFISWRQSKNNSGKGRPNKYFKLSIPIQEIISEKAAEIETEMKTALETAHALMAVNK